MFWRFRITGDPKKWQLWRTKLKPTGYDEDVLTFIDPETEVSLEAWTQCGLAMSFTFNVLLHVNSPVDVCAQFGEMWYQTSVSRLPITTQMCSYTDSDFADFTFDFHPSYGLQYSRTALPVKVSKVVCNGALDNQSPAKLFELTRASPTGVMRFAVEMVNTSTTKPLTNFAASCDFEYTDYSGATRTKTCGRSFALVDCTAPKYEQRDAICPFNTCAGSSKHGFFEACGGTIVKSTITNTSKSATSNAARAALARLSCARPFPVCPM